MNIKRVLYGYLLFVMMFFANAANSKYSIIPKPALVQNKSGNFLLTNKVAIMGDEALKNEIGLLKAQLKQSTGIRFKKSGSKRIQLSIDPALAEKSDSAYRLAVTTEGITLKGASAAGVFYGCQSLLQLLPPAVYSSKVDKKQKWQIPCVVIEDQPRFKWRGMHLDVGRHFMPVKFIKKFIDQLAIVKMNTLHLHLTEDHGWRIEIKKYPKLTQLGSKRKQTMIHPDKRIPGRPIYDGKPHGGFYTQKELKDLVAYAAERHITIMPEIELPGHSQAALTAYPEFGCTGEKLELKCEPGVSPHLYNVNDETFEFLENILTEVFEIFPSKYIHIGGDEAPKGQWKNSPVAQAKIKELGLKDEDELQSWFINRIGKFLKENGRQLVGWQEIMHGGTPENAVVMPWMNIQSGFKAANSGHDVVIATTYPNYFDSKQSTEPSEPPALMNGPFTLAKVYNQTFDFKQIKKDKQKHILGAQGQLWTEYMPTPSVVEYQAFPRVLALAEAVWTPLKGKNFGDFKSRLQNHGKRMKIQGVNYRYIDSPEAAKWKEKDFKKGYVEFSYESISNLEDLFIKITQYPSKSNLAVEKVEVIVDSKVLASDEHYGTTASKGLRNIYRLKLKKLKKLKNFKVRVTGKIVGDKGVSGLIFAHQGREAWKYRAEKIKSPTLPVGYWDTISAGKRTRVTFDATPFLKKRGPYMVTFKHTDGKGQITVKSVELIQSGGAIDTCRHETVITEANARNGYLVKVNNNRKKTYLRVTLDGPAVDSNGYIYISPVSVFRRVKNVITWKPENLQKNFAESQFDVGDLIKEPGKYSVKFNYQRGGNGLDINNVSLVKGDTVLCSDKHVGFTGGQPKKNEYILEVKELEDSKGLKIYANVRGAGGIDSHGDVTITKIQ